MKQLVDHLRQDVRYALRQMARSPVFTSLALFSLGIGITVAVTAFSLINGVLFKPLPVNDPGGVVHIYTTGTREDYLYGGSAYLDLNAYQESGVFASVAAYRGSRSPIAANGHSPRRTGFYLVSPNYFQTLGQKLTKGRPFSPSGELFEIILSEPYRRRMFDPGQDVIGAIVRVNNVPLTVVGVAPVALIDMGAFESPAGWVPAPLLPYIYPRTARMNSDPAQQLTDRAVRYWGMVARLRDDAKPEAADSRLGPLARELSNRYPDAWRNARGAPRRISILSHRNSIIKPDDTNTLAALATVTALVVIVLVLACTNVAGLLLARGISRRHEVAMRLTLGASRSRLFSQLMTESVLLGLLGGVVGVLGTIWVTRLASRSALFEVFDLSPDWRVLLAAFLVSLLCAVIFGVTPSNQVLAKDVKSTLSGYGIVGERGGVRGRLVALQVCLSCLLILIATYAGRGIRARMHTDSGLELNGLVVAELDLMGFRNDTLRRAAYVRDALDIVRSMPGVQNVTVTSRLPLTGSVGRDRRVDIPGYGMAMTGYYAVGDGYFETLGFKVSSGRSISAEDTRNGSSVAVVNRTFVETFGHGVLGRTVRIDGNREVRIVGVVQDVRHRARDYGTAAFIYEAATAQSSPVLELLARVAPGQQQRLAEQLTRTLRDRYPDRVAPSVAMFQERLARALAPQRYIANVALGIGITELLLGALGLYSILLYSLLARTREVGVRMALGARPRDASFAVIREGLGYALIGAVMGLILCIPAAIFAGKNFIGAQSGDPVPFIAVVLAVLLSSLAAAWLPARRAARIQPLDALRHE